MSTLSQQLVVNSNTQIFLAVIVIVNFMLMSDDVKLYSIIR